MARKYTQTKRIENSYTAYRKNWFHWKLKGYAMQTKEPMSFEDYKKNYRLAQLAKEKNIAAGLAAEGRVTSHTEATLLNRMLQEQKESGDAELQRRIERQFKSVKDIKKNIDKWTYSAWGNVYTGRQALYLEWDFLFGTEAADELFGY